MVLLKLVVNKKTILCLNITFSITFINTIIFCQELMEEGEIKKTLRQRIWDFYYGNYKRLLLIPFLLLLGSLIFLGIFVSSTGEIIHKDVSLKGGVTLTVPLEGDVDVDKLQGFLDTKYPSNDVSIRVLRNLGKPIGVVVDADITPERDQIDSLIGFVGEDLGVDMSQIEYGEETVGSSLGANFFKEAIRSIFIAFLFMGLVVFLYFGYNIWHKVLAVVLTIIAMILIFSINNFIGDIAAYAITIILLILYARTSIPSIAVILAAFSDIVVTLAIVDLLGIKIGTAGIAAFLMLIGYSVDTDVLLTVRVMKRKEGTVQERVLSSIKTGMTMTITGILAVLVALFITQSAIIRQIMIILLIGLFVDLINTWIQNVGLLRWYIDRKQKKGESYQ